MSSEIITHTLDEEQWSVELLAAGDRALPGIEERSFDAFVPSCVHAVLMDAGVIEHIDSGFAELAQEWVGRCDWRYTCRFDAPPRLLDCQCVELVCEGLDTVCTLRLNGQEIGSADNQFHPHRFDVRSALRPGANELQIDFVSPVRFAEEQCRRLGKLPYADFGHPYPYVRKSACNFGWDWGPRMPTVGVWRSIHLLGWNTARLDEPRVEVERVDRESAAVVVAAPVAAAGELGDDWSLVAELRCPDGRRVTASHPVSGEGEYRLRLEINKPPLWWPRGYGPQRMCRIRTELRRGDQTVDFREFETGLRSVRLDTSPDEHGSRFQIEINGVPVFCKGANWIPLDVYTALIEPQEYEAEIQSAVEANMNMLRVWGGGIYEHEEFYRLCDRLGIMVWQDFMFACAGYPEAEPLRSQVEREARYNIARLSRHPCVVLWCGGNECLMMAEQWNFSEKVPEGTAWGTGYYFDLLPRLLEELKPPAVYWPNSPYSGDRERSVLDCDHGNRHTWDRAVEGYREQIPRFVTEFGHQGPANLASWDIAAREEELSTDSPLMEHRQRAADGNEGRYRQFLDKHFAGLETFERWVYAAQLLQARAVSLGITWWRVHRPRCMGTLFWQLNDCWTAHSWSAIDYTRIRKLLWYAVRDAFADRMICVHPVDDNPVLMAANDALRPWTTTLHARRVRFDGEVLAECELKLELAPASSQPVADLHEVLGRPDDPLAELLVIDGAQVARACWFYARDRELRYPEPAWDVRIDSRRQATIVEIRAGSLLRDVCLWPEEMESWSSADNQLVTLLPGERARFRFEPVGPLAFEVGDFECEPQFNCANWLTAQGGA